MKNIVKKIYINRFAGCIFHTLQYCLEKELENCESVLDLGCGSNSPLRYCHIKFSVGVEAFKPYLNQSKKHKIHNKYLLADINKVKFKPKAFDAVILIDVLEHLSKKDGVKLIKNAEIWARKKVIISSPNGFVKQGNVDNNIFQSHRSGWLMSEICSRGYTAYGMAGLKNLRTDHVSDKTKNDDNFYSSIRFQPKIFWFFISTLTQVLTYYLPKYAFSLLYIKNI